MQVTIGRHAIEFGPKRLRLTADGAPVAPYEHLRVRPVTPFIGAEIEGVDLASPAPAQIDELKRALLERKVLFFRDQNHLTAHHHRDFAAHWGGLEVHPLLDQGAIPEVVRFDRSEDNPGMENIWHVDVSWQQRPPLGSVLRAIDVPDAGGDTLWSDMGNAYDALPQDVKEQIDGLTATHDFTPSFGLGMSPEKLASMQAQGSGGRASPPVRRARAAACGSRPPAARTGRTRRSPAGARSGRSPSPTARAGRPGRARPAPAGRGSRRSG